MAILVITAGGTIGTFPYDEDGHDFVHEEIEKWFPQYEIRCHGLKPDLNDDVPTDEILAVIREAPEKRIVITQKLATILHNAEIFHNAMASDARFHKKKIILTGSEIPFANGLGSDAYGNLGLSLYELKHNKINLNRVNIVLHRADRHGLRNAHLSKFKMDKFEFGYDENGHTGIRRRPEPSP